uniref:Uncharacterized protein n=1 Tax=Oryza glaberrima TaxID=4538 RepID=I1Q613_ORYGL
MASSTLRQRQWQLRGARGEGGGSGWTMVTAQWLVDGTASCCGNGAHSRRRQRRGARGDGRGSGEVAIGSSGCNGGEAWRSRKASRGCGRRLHLAGAVVIGGVGGRLGVERRSCWQWRSARRERHGRRQGGRNGVRGTADGGKPDWHERLIRWWRRTARRDEARPAVKEATTM